MTNFSQSKGRAAEQEFRSTKPRPPDDRLVHESGGPIVGALIGALAWALILWLVFKVF